MTLTEGLGVTEGTVWSAILGVEVDVGSDILGVAEDDGWSNIRCVPVGDGEATEQRLFTIGPGGQVSTHRIFSTS